MMNHESRSMAVSPGNRMPSSMAYTPAKNLNTPVKSQSSPLYYYGLNRTPLSRVQQLSGYRGTSQMKTPGSGYTSRHIFQISNTPSSTYRSSHQTDSCYNPFEACLVDSLHGPIFSPNVFKTSTPGEGRTPAKFQWSIDDIAVLRPADIDEHGLHETWNTGSVNSEMEEQAQKAIDTYFSSHIVVPSPWTDSSKKKPFVLPATPAENSIMDSPMIFSAKATGTNINRTPVKQQNSSNCNQRSELAVKKDVASQTVLTLPMDFNLEAILSQFYSYQGVDMAVAENTSRQGSCHDDDDGTNQDFLSNSSLRRKLFFHDDQGTPISPVRCNGYGSNLDRSTSSEDLSPMKHGQVPLCSSDCDVTNLSHVNDLSYIDQFSSSPIKASYRTPTFRRCSTTPLLIGSPAVSPIKANECSSPPSVCEMSPVATTSFTDGACHLRSPVVFSSPLFSTSSVSESLSVPVSSPAHQGYVARQNMLTTETTSCRLADDLHLPVSDPEINHHVEPLVKLQSVESYPENNVDIHLNWYSNLTTDETTSMSQDLVPYDSQHAPLTLSADTGYQSNLLHMTNGTACFSAQLDSVLHAQTEDDMSCDSSMLHSHHLATVAMIAADKAVVHAVGEMHDRDNFSDSANRPTSMLGTYSLDTLYPIGNQWKHEEYDKSIGSDFGDRNRSHSQPEIYFSFSESL